MKNIKKSIISSRRQSEWFASQQKPDAQKGKNDESKPKTA